MHWHKATHSILTNLMPGKSVMVSPFIPDTGCWCLLFVFHSDQSLQRHISFIIHFKKSVLGFVICQFYCFCFISILTFFFVTWHSYKKLFLIVMRTFKFYSLSSFQIYNTELLTIVTMLCIVSYDKFIL